MTRKINLALLNPNTNGEATRFMTEIARNALPRDFDVTGHTMKNGPRVVSNRTELAEAAAQVIETGIELAARGVDAILVSGFGDPGARALREQLSIPVTGIAEAGIAAAAKGGRRFSIITTTENLKTSIADLVEEYGHNPHFASVRITAGDMHATMDSLDLLERALMDTARQCLEEDGAEVLLIGGGPLAPAARALAQELNYPIVEPVRAGAILAGYRAKTGQI